MNSASRDLFKDLGFPSPTTLFTALRHMAWLTFSAMLFFTVSGLVVRSTAAQDRVVRVSNMATAAGVQSQVEMPIRLVSQGNETSASFSISFNTFIMTNPVIALGSDMPAGSTIEVNTADLAQGRIGVRVNSPSTFSTGIYKIVTATFTIPAASATVGIYPVQFSSIPTPQSVSNATGAPLQANFENGVVSVGTADGVGLAGRVLTPDGRALANVTIIATDTNGDRRLARTSSFGNFSFPYLTLGRSYTFTVPSKRYRFAPRVVQIGDLLTNFDFIGLE